MIEEFLTTWAEPTIRLVCFILGVNVGVAWALWRLSR